MYDFRIMDFSPNSVFRRQYDLFLNGQPQRMCQGNHNEFEPVATSIEEIEEKIGFVIKSIEVFFFPYMTEEKLIKSRLGNLSSHASSVDYHNVCKGIMKNIIEKKALDLRYQYIQCDNGYFNERFFAINSGLCKRGLNSMAIHEDYGSYGFLGIIASKEEKESYITKKEDCMNCKLCIEVCPGKAISEGDMKRNNCLSYLTQKKLLSRNEEVLLGHHSKIYGCDVCQLICPENSHIKYTEIGDFQENLLYNIGLEEINLCSNREFKARYGKRSLSWRGKNILKRNIKLIKK